MFERRRQTWADLTPTQRGGILTGAAVQILLQVAALRDLRRRSTAEVRGSKRWWTAATFVNFAGPIAYFAAGRR